MLKNDVEMMAPPIRRMVSGVGDASRVIYHTGRSPRDAGITTDFQHLPAAQAEQLPSLWLGIGPSSKL